MRNPSSLHRLWFPALLAAALLVRSFGLLSRPICYDEAFSILFAEKGPAEMVRGTLGASGGQAAEEHPLGHYFLLWGWMEFFGRSLPAIRVLGILAGLGSVWLVFAIARELFTEKTALLAALFTALSPFQVHFSQEIRMYAFLGFWLLLTTYAFLRARSTRQAGWWLLFALAAALAQYTHTLASLYLIPLAITPIFQRDWRTLRAVLLSAALAVLLYLPWLIHIPAQLAKVQTSYWLPRPGPEKLFTLLLVYVTNLPLPEGWLPSALGISLFALFIGLWQTFLAVRAGDKGSAGSLWLLYLASAPPLLSFILSQWQPVFLERTFLPSAAAFCAWLAWALFDTRLPQPVQYLVAVGLAVGALTGLYQHVTYAGFPYAPWREVQSSLAGRLQPGDAILHSSKLTYLPALYYDASLPQRFIADPSGSEVDTLAPATQQVLGVASSPDLESAASDSSRLWFIIFQQSMDEYASAGRGTHPQLAWLERHYRLESVESWADLRLYLFHGEGE